MAICQDNTSAVLRSIPFQPNENISFSGFVTILLIYLFFIVYKSSWGPFRGLHFRDISKVVRKSVLAVGASSQWFFDLIFPLVTTYMIEHIGCATLFVLGYR